MIGGMSEREIWMLYMISSYENHEGLVGWMMMMMLYHSYSQGYNYGWFGLYDDGDGRVLVVVG